jgi:hypothetical protein
MDKVGAIKQRLEEVKGSVNHEAGVHLSLALQHLNQPTLQLRNIAATIVAIDSAAQAETKKDLKQYLLLLEQYLSHALA